MSVKEGAVSKGERESKQAESRLPSPGPLYRLPAADVAQIKGGSSLQRAGLKGHLPTSKDLD